MAKISLLSLLALSGSLFAAPTYELADVVPTGLRDPMELSVAPNGDLYVVEREGRVLRVRPQTGGVFEIGQIEVAARREGGGSSPIAAEEGLLGIALDPKFQQNRRLFLYYSDPVKKLIRLSRFTLKDGLLDRASELMLLEVPVERDKTNCHNAGSIAFGPDGLLYLSLGDNTNPFESAGHAPIDDRPNRGDWDAQRSAGNTNDLRGKILRIRPTEKGYEIPRGNLFPPGTPKTRPEIYVMGCRNPFRISIDPKKSIVYWGEVGPDANGEGPRGPRGFDEVNQARKAGNFGWPFVIADNRPYPIVDFATGKPGEMTDPAAPKNPGTRNTGLAVLPPAQPALIYYPYAESAEFPVMGKGSRNAMAGPVFYHERNRKWNLLGPDENHTLLTYDWARGKIWKAKLDNQEKLQSLEPFVDKLMHPMDLEMAADGTVWLLEYGSGWYFNKNGRIRRLRPATDNRAPVIVAEAVAGQPNTFTVKSVTDEDKDAIAFRWFLTTGADEKDLGKEPTVTVPAGAGSELRAVAIDTKGGVTVKRFPLEAAKVVEPTLALEFPAKPAALAFGETLAFKVTAPTAPDAKGVSVRARYIPPTGHDAGGPEFPAEIRDLITARLCFACHQVDAASVGPRYVEVGLRHRDRADAADYLKERILKGSTGTWGEVPMPPQAVSEADAGKIVSAILALSEGISFIKGSSAGELKLPPAPAGSAPGGAWEISAEAPGYLPARVRLGAK